jgi:hypothetical protein
MKNIFSLLLFSLGIAFSGAAQSRLYVNPTALGQNNGLTWTDAFTDLHQALTIAQAGDAIWVAEGEYRTDTANNRDKSFVLKSGVKLYGSFEGVETSPAQRDLAAHPTVLSGNIGSPMDSTDNAYTILYMAFPDTSTRLDGLIFRHGFAKSDTNFNQISPVQSGAAVYVVAQGGKGMPTFVNCTFRDNYAQSYGGAYYVYAQSTSGSTPLFRNCVFFNNKAGKEGGAVFIAGGNSYDRGIEFDHCKFDLNTAFGDFNGGGGIYMANAFGPETINFLGCEISRNKYVFSGAFLFLWRTGMNAVKLDIDSCIFQSNGVGCVSTIELSGFPVERQNVFKLKNSRFLDDGSSTSPISWSSTLPQNSLVCDTFLALNNLFTRHTNTYGIISISSYHLWVKIKSNFFIQNKGTWFDPDRNIAIFARGSNIEISKNVFIGNKTPIVVQLRTRPDARLLIEGNVFQENKKQIEVEVYPQNVATPYLAPAYIVNNVFLNNLVLPEGDVTQYEISKNILFNNVFVGNKSTVTGLPTLPLRLGYDTFYFAYNLFDTSSYCTDFPYVTCGPNNLFNLDPQFRDPANFDFSLLPCSPLINAGSNLAAAGILTDFTGSPRIQEGTVDIGAYESPGFALASIPTIKPACIGASNGSISVEPAFGCEPYTYNWLPAAGIGPELDGLTPGNYLLTITDGSGRQILDTLSVSSAPLPELAPVSTDVQCSNGLGGSISSGINQGTPPYHFQWLPLAADTSYLSALPPGNYALTVTDANGCQDSAATSIALQGMISLMLDGQVIPCHGETGWLSATPVTGAAPYQWLWQGWPGTDSLAQPLGPGQYSVTVTDSYGCTASNTYPPMTEPGLLTASIDSDPQTDLSQPNGAAELTNVAGGSPAFPPLPPYQFNWSTGGNNGGMESFIGGLTAGTYTVTVTDKNGCTLALEVVVDLMVGTADPSARALLLYPNPATDWVRVVLPEGTGACTVELLDASGRILQSLLLPHAADKGQLDLQGLPGGSYWVRVLDGGMAVFGAVLKI